MCGAALFVNRHITNIKVKCAQNTDIFFLPCSPKGGDKKICPRREQQWGHLHLGRTWREEIVCKQTDETQGHSQRHREQYMLQLNVVKRKGAAGKAVP